MLIEDNAISQGLKELILYDERKASILQKLIMDLTSCLACKN